jgi:hypothetical protein
MKQELQKKPNFPKREFNKVEVQTENPEQVKAFREWLTQVSESLVSKFGGDITELPKTVPFRTWFNDEVKPDEAADKALTMCGLGDDEFARIFGVK